MVNIKKLASKGYQVAFAKKSNRDKYLVELKKHGYKGFTIRSSGPTVDRNPTGKKSFYVIPEKVKKKTRVVRRTSRRTSSPFGINIKYPRF